MTKMVYILIQPKEKVRFLDIRYIPSHQNFSVRFSSSTESCFHHAHCFLPVCLSHALDKRPDLVSLAVRCFCKDIINNAQVISVTYAPEYVIE